MCPRGARSGPTALLSYSSVREVRHVAAAGTLAGTGDRDTEVPGLGSATKGLRSSRGSRPKCSESVHHVSDAASLTWSPSSGDFVAEEALQRGVFDPLHNSATWTSRGATRVGLPQTVPPRSHPQPLDKPEGFVFVKELICK